MRFALTLFASFCQWHSFLAFSILFFFCRFYFQTPCIVFESLFGVAGMLPLPIAHFSCIHPHFASIFVCVCFWSERIFVCCLLLLLSTFYPTKLFTTPKNDLFDFGCAKIHESSLPKHTHTHILWDWVACGSDARRTLCAVVYKFIKHRLLWMRVICTEFKATKTSTQRK